MADRIAVMDAGHIDQLAAPSEIYDRPATPFVADFIGEMNHLEGTLERDGDQLVGVVGQARFGIGRVIREARAGSARAARRAAGGDPRDDGRRGRAGGLPDRDGARPRRPGGREAGDRRRGRRRAATQQRGATDSTPATRCGSDGARRQRCCSAPRTTAREGRARRSHSKFRPDPEKGIDEDGRSTRRAQHPGPRRAGGRGEPHGHAPAGALRRRCSGDGRVRRGLRRLDRRRRVRRLGRERRRGRGGLGREAPDPGRRQGRGRRPAAGELGRLLRPGELQGLREASTARRSRSRASARTTRSSPSCGRAARSTTSSPRPATR